MVHAGLGENWDCKFANDIDEKKAASYRANWGDNRLFVADIHGVSPANLPSLVDLAWASFPCQDLSLAGAQGGLEGSRSGTFWAFWALMVALAKSGRAPKLIALENVCGTLTSHGGKDFMSICLALVGGGYRLGALVIDAVAFLPQSRPRLFVIGLRNGLAPPRNLRQDLPGFGHTKQLMATFARMPTKLKEQWIWWSLPEPPARRVRLEDLIEEAPTGVGWHSDQDTRRLLSLMAPHNRDKIEEVKRTGQRRVGTVYRRTRKGTQRAEVRFDGISGCLRTPSGGSSRQTIVIVEGEKVRSRLLSPREAARLMGLSDSYLLPDNYNAAYHLAGDGVAVPVVQHLSRHLFEPIVDANRLSTNGHAK